MGSAKYYNKIVFCKNMFIQKKIKTAKKKQLKVLK